MILATLPTSTRQFHYDPALRTYTAEVSSTNGLSRVYDDACDEGMTLVNPSTGGSVAFVIVKTIRAADGDVLAWNLRPATRPELDVTVVLFND